MSIEQTRRVYKYTLERADQQTISLPAHGHLLKVAMQDGNICIWWQFTEGYGMQDFNFLIVGTGHAIPENMSVSYIDSVFDGPFVWHIYIVDTLESIIKKSFG